MKSYFENVVPEAIDIKGKGILDFFDAVRKNGLELHSFKMIRHGKCCASAWFYPYGPDKLHPVYSFSKSLTATAIGFAWQEKLLSLDEKLVDIFPEYCPESPSDNLKEVTLHHLLTMSCGHETEIDGSGPDWIAEFLHHPFEHKPGTFYRYNTAGTNMLAAVLAKRTGQDLIEFLKPRLFEPLGIDPVFCYRLKDEYRTCLGGGGMKLTTEGMARFTYFMLHNGEWNGRKLLSGWYEMAGSRQIETAGDAEGHVKEWANGYGYQCWMGSLPGSYRADGAFGQFGFVFPMLDLIIIMTSATEQTQTLVDCLYEYLIPAVCPDGMLKGEKETDLTESLSDLKISGLLSCRNPVVEEEISAGMYQADADGVEKKMSSLEMLIGGSGLRDLPDESSIFSMRFAFHGDYLEWMVLDGEEEKRLTAALDGSFAISQIGDVSYAASARWRALYALEMEIRRIDAISGVRLIFRFDGERMKIEADETLITVGGLGMNEKQLVPFHFIKEGEKRQS